MTRIIFCAGADQLRLVDNHHSFLAFYSPRHLCFATTSPWSVLIVPIVSINLPDPANHPVSFCINSLWSCAATTAILYCPQLNEAGHFVNISSVIIQYNTTVSVKMGTKGRSVPRIVCCAIPIARAAGKVLVITSRKQPDNWVCEWCCTEY